MDEGLREELNRAFHSTARAQFVKNQLSSVYGRTISVDEKVTVTLFIFTKSKAEGILRQKYYNITSFVSSIEKSYSLSYIKAAVNYTLELLAEYSGAVNILWDLGAIDPSEAEEYFIFAGELKGELILFKNIKE